jgi:hypothetical protein
MKEDRLKCLHKAVRNNIRCLQIGVSIHFPCFNRGLHIYLVQDLVFTQKVKLKMAESWQSFSIVLTALLTKSCRMCAKFSCFLFDLRNVIHAFVHALERYIWKQTPVNAVHKNESLTETLYMHWKDIHLKTDTHPYAARKIESLTKHFYLDRCRYIWKPTSFHGARSIT